jgi:hypothetical protein
MLKELQGTKSTMDQNLEQSQLKLFKDSHAITNDEYVSDEDENGEEFDSEGEMSEGEEGEDLEESDEEGDDFEEGDEMEDGEEEEEQQQEREGRRRAPEFRRGEDESIQNQEIAYDDDSDTEALARLKLPDDNEEESHWRKNIDSFSSLYLQRTPKLMELIYKRKVGDPQSHCHFHSQSTFFFFIGSCRTRRRWRIVPCKERKPRAA